MSGFLAVDLDAKTAMPKVARAAGISVGDVSWGLLELWEHAWREKVDTVDATVIGGCFGGTERIGFTIAALVAFGFLERVGEGYRIRGAERYLRIQAARSAGGKAAAGNLRKGKSAGTPAGEVSRLPPGSLPAAAGDQPETSPGSVPALQRAANSEQRTAIETTATAAAQVPPPPVADRPRLVAVYEKPDTPPDGWLAEDFWRWAQWKRQQAKLVGEPERDKPRDLGTWYSQALMALGGNVEALQEAFYRFGENKHWQEADPPLPFRAFVAQWTKFVPRGAARAGT